MLVDFQIFLDVMSLGLGLALGIMLMVLNKKKRKSSFFLGLFVFFFSLKQIHFIGRSFILNGDYPELLLLPFNFSWLLFPLFLIYSQQVSVFSNRRPPYWTLIPGIIFAIVQVYLYFLPYDIKLSVSENPLHDFFHTYVGIFYSWAIAIWNFKILYQHRIEVRNSFSQVETKELQWARIFLIYSITISIFIHILYFISSVNIYFKILFSTFDLITIFWTAFHGISQRNIISVLNNENSNIDFSRKLKNKTIAQPISNEVLQKLTKQIDDYVLSSKAFVNADLTIVDLAENLKIHPKRISTSINTVRKQNFNSYINKFRIEKAVELIQNNESHNYSMEGIGTEVGFNSKSAFYASFKKVTGTTPTQYRESLVAL